MKDILHQELLPEQEHKAWFLCLIFTAILSAKDALLEWATNKAALQGLCMKHFSRAWVKFSAHLLQLAIWSQFGYLTAVKYIYKQNIYYGG